MDYLPCSKRDCLVFLRKTRNEGFRYLPPCVVLFGEPDKVPDLDLLPIVGGEAAVIAPEGLVHLAEDQTEVRPRDANLEG